MLVPRLQSAVALLREGRAAEAAADLRQIVREHPDVAEARRLFGLALRDMGSFPEAEGELRAALALDPACGSAALTLSELLLASGRPLDAEAAVAPLAARSGADLGLLTAHGDALKAAGRSEEALAAYERGARVAPLSGVAEHNFAATLGDLERFAESEAATRRAFAKGLDAPETWLVHARALVGQYRHEEADAAYRQVIRRRPEQAEAHGELAQLIWMRTADAKAATVTLDAAIAAFPGQEALALKKIELLEYAGDAAGALELAARAAAHPQAGPMAHLFAARLWSRTDPRRALEHALIAERAAPQIDVVLSNLCEAYLAAGEARQAAAVAERLRALSPLNQHGVALLATAWRMLDDPRYRRLYDYDRFVRTARIDTPKGWPNLETYLADLAASLRRLHTLKTHPVGQSVRHGTQTSQSLTRSDDPAIRAFFDAVDGPIRAYIATLAEDDDPVSGRNTGAYRFNGAWSVRLAPDGYHADHLHPFGWLSSACYISLPKAIERGREGWLRFGHPGVATTPDLAAESFVKPELGLLALFPSYMWHGTIPFSGGRDAADHRLRRRPGLGRRVSLADHPPGGELSADRGGGSRGRPQPRDRSCDQGAWTRRRTPPGASPRRRWTGGGRTPGRCRPPSPASDNSRP